ncbi:MAG: hypothetical protein K9M56_06910 [Victivallales bacterium]|nr:hypothetical protein [Victivallales bacterium]
MFDKKKNFTVLLMFVLIFMFDTVSAGVLGGRKVETESDKKVLRIERIVKRAFKQDSDSTDYNAIKEAIIDEVKDVFPLEKGSKIKKINFSKIEERAERKTQNKYPLTTEELRKKYKKEAKEKFTPAKLNEKVNVKYKMGYDKIIKVAGVYRGLNRYHNGIKVGRKVVPVFDLLPEDKVKFNKDFRELTREKYVRENIKEYLENKENYQMGLIKKNIKKIDKENEDAGYIKAWHNWRTPENVASMIYKYYLVQVMKENKQRSTQQPSTQKQKTVKRNNTPKQNVPKNKQNKELKGFSKNVDGRKKDLKKLVKALE